MTVGVISAKDAVARAQWGVTGPVFLCMFGVPALVFASVKLATNDDSLAKAAAGIGLFVGWPLAWLCWSILTPRWRLWAYERVANLDELKRLAVAESVIWPDGHIFERTEIRPSSLRKRLRELETEHAAKDL